MRVWRIKATAEAQEIALRARHKHFLQRDRHLRRDCLLAGDQLADARLFGFKHCGKNAVVPSASGEQCLDKLARGAVLNLSDLFAMMINCTKSQTIFSATGYATS